MSKKLKGKPMKKITAVASTALLAVGLVMTGAMGASAARAPHPDPIVQPPTPVVTTVTAVWTIPGGKISTPFAVPQTLYSQTSGSHLNSVAVPTTCGTAYQADVYNVSDGSIALLASKTLAGPSGDSAFLIGGSGVGYRLIQNDACPPPVVVPPVVVTPTVEFSYSATCGSLTLTTVSTGVNEGWYYGTQALVDGARVGSAVLKGSGTKTTVIPFAEDSHGGSVDVDVQTYASTEQDILPDGWALGVSHMITVKTDCEATVVPPVVTPPVVTPPVVTPPVVTPPVTHVTPKAPTAVQTGDGSPIAPWAPVGGMLALATLLGIAATRKFATK